MKNKEYVIEKIKDTIKQIEQDFWHEEGDLDTYFEEVYESVNKNL